MPPPAKPPVDLASLLSMDPERGRIHLGRERMLLVSAQAMGALRRELHDSLGTALSAEVLFRFGQRCGTEEAERVVRDLGVESRDEALGLGPLLHAFEGVARVRTDVLRSDPADGGFYMEGTWEGSYEAEQHLRLFGISPDPVCMTLTGYATGYASAVVGRDLLCRETRCRGRGDAECAWAISPAPALLPEKLPAELRTAYQGLEARIRGQEALVQSMTEISDAFGQVVYTVDERGIITSWNRAAAEVFGHPAEAVLGRHERILFPGDRVAAREPEALLEQCREGRVSEETRRRVQADGAAVTVRGGRSPIRSPDGLLVGATVVLRRVTPGPPGEDSAGRTLQALLDHVPAGIALATADQRIVECNRGFREMLGLPDGPVDGVTCYSLLAGIGEPCAECRSDQVFEVGATTRCRPSFTRPDGSRVYFDLRSFPIRDAAGKVTHELKYVRDTTREVERDQELDDKRRLAAVGEMAARVAHEVKNPLAGMRGALQVLASRRPPGDPDREILVEVVAHIDRLDSTVRDLLTYSRPLRLHREFTRPDDVVQAVLSLLGNGADFRDLRVDFRPGGAPEAPLDRQQMIQVLTNLVQNAAQALRPGDDRTVSVAAVTAGEGTSVEFQVRDRGPGIPANLRSRIAAPFFTTKARGTGLGLAISRKIVEAHRGTLEFECPADGGTIFRVRLPLRDGTGEV